jgi:CheY-like chemotaxis protein
MFGVLVSNDIRNPHASCDMLAIVVIATMLDTLVGKVFASSYLVVSSSRLGLRTLYLNSKKVLALTKRDADSCGTQSLLCGAGFELVTVNSMTLARCASGVKGAIVCRGSWSEQERENIVSELAALSKVIVRCPGCTGWVETSQTPGVLSDTKFLTSLISALARVPKIFVVDDEKQIADGLSFALRERGFKVETFYNPCAALRRASVCPPDILVSDITMPQIDGIALATALRRQSPDSKVILISGNPEWKTRGNLRNGTLDGFTLLSKPFSLSQLLRLIETEES